MPRAGQRGGGAWSQRAPSEAASPEDEPWRDARARAPTAGHSFQSLSGLRMAQALMDARKENDWCRPRPGEGGARRGG